MRPNTYANAANVPARMAVRPAARPSNPSVRFTAFELPVTTTVTKRRYNGAGNTSSMRSEEHTSELQSRLHLVCRLLLEKKNNLAFPGHLYVYRLPQTRPATADHPH